MGHDHNHDAESALRFINTQDVLMTGTRLLTPASVFLTVEGAEGKNFKVDGGEFSKAGKPLTVDKGTTPAMVKLRE